VHAVTRPNVIRSLLALQVGQPCSELRRYETERILRAQPFLSQVHVLAFAADSGGVRIDIETVDEVSLLGAVTARSASPHVVAARLGDGNLAGEGIRLVGDWADGLGLRDRWAGRITDYAFAGRPYVLTLQGERDVLGGSWLADLSHPFFSDLQQIAWLAQMGEVRTYVAFRNAANIPAPVALDYSHHFEQIGGVVRVEGNPGRIALFGASVSDERDAPSLRPSFLPPGGGVRPDTNAAFVSRYAPLNAFRVNAIFGVRSIRFMRSTGVTSLSGEEDLMLGTEVGLVAGHSIVPFGTARDVLLSSGLYTATASHRVFIGLLVRSEARDDLSGNEWDDVLVSGRLAVYWKPSAWHTVMGSTEFGLGVNERLPFSLSFADARGGVRGFSASQASGGERVVTRLEDRWRLGSFKGLAEFGVAGFTDMGRLWSQGVPYGVNSPTAVGVGISLLAAVPIHSKRTWRVDFALPVTHDPNARFTVRVTSIDGSAHFYIEPSDIALARSRTVPSEIFQYPAE
jgi:hypothetical protein